MLKVLKYYSCLQKASLSAPKLLDRLLSVFLASITGIYWCCSIVIKETTNG